MIQRLKYPSIVRNVIVHKAGVCDQQYKDKAETKPLLPQLENRRQA